MAALTRIRCGAATATTSIIVDDVGDVVTESANQGIDEVITTLGSYTLGANVENLFFDDAAGKAIGIGTRWTTRSTAMPATTSWTAARATTRCTAAAATTR
jgi:hypothetical protein